MSSRYGSNSAADWLLDGAPTTSRTSNMSTLDCNADLAALTTQVMTSVALPMQPGDVVTNLTFVSGATAAGTPTNWWFALYSPTGALLAQTADQLTAAWAASTVKTLALTTPQMATSAAVYYAAVMVKATTVPTLVGANLGIAAAAAAIVGSKVLAQTSGSALTTTAPATIASPTTVATVPLVVAT